MQGELIIGTKIDDSGFDKDYEKLKNKANNNEIEVSGKTTEQLQRELKSLTQKLDEINEKTETLKDKKIKIDLELKDTYSKEMEEIAEQYNYATSPNFEFQFSNDPTYNMPTLQKTLDWLDPIYQKKIDDVNRKYQKQINSLNEINKKILSNKDASEEIRKKVEITTKELEKKKFSSILENASDSIKNVGKSVERIIKRIGRWALAIFGIRSAYMAVRNAINVISQDDEQLKADIDYMKKAFAYVLEPIARKIVEWAKQLMIYLGYIIKAWTGRNIFENANKSLAGANKNAKELQKTTAGFDEMNILSDSSSSGGSIMPSFDLSQIDGEVPDWVKWIGENGELIKNIILGIGIAIASLKLAELLKTLGLFSSLPIWQLAAGIALILSGLILTISGIIDFLKNPTWGNFLKILEGIALIISGIALLTGGWITALIALGVAIVANVIRNWDKVKEILGNVGTWIYENIIEPVGKFFGFMWDWLVQAAIDTWGSIKATFADVAGFFGKVFGDAWETVKNIFSTGGRIFMGITEGILNAFKVIVNAIIDGINNVVAIPFRGINTALGALRSLDLWGWKPFEWLGLINVPRIPKLAKGGIVNNPSKGIPIGGAIAGESGREGVLPLDDAAVLSEIADAIGSRITINANIINTMNGRIISRELQKIKADNDFAYNR